MKPVPFFVNRDSVGWNHNRKAAKTVMAKNTLDCRFAPLVFQSESAVWSDPLVIRVSATALFTTAIDDYVTEDREEHYPDVWPFGAFMNTNGELTVYVWCKSSRISSKIAQCAFEDLRGSLMIYEYDRIDGRLRERYTNKMLSLRTRLQPLSKQ